MDAAFAAAGFEYVIDEWLMPALVTVGQAWVNGQLDIAQEHFISAAEESGGVGEIGHSCSV